MRRYPADTSWADVDRRTFGVLPGRGKLRSVRIWAVRFLGLVSAKVVLLVEIVRAHSDAYRERFRLRRRASALRGERSQALQQLGEAAIYGDRQDVEQAKERVSGLDADLRTVSEEVEQVKRELQARLDTVHRDEGATAAVEPVPEPVPAPSEPPGPVIVPEPEPVPHEPPGPVIVPEPQPPAGTRRRR